MTTLCSPLIALAWIAAPDSLPIGELRWQITGIGIAAILLTMGCAGLLFFFFRKRTRDRSLLFISLFSLLYALRLLFRQSLMQSLIPVSSGFWAYFDLVIDCYISVPLTLFLIETVEARWKAFLRWLLAFQIVFQSARLLSRLFAADPGPMEIAHNIVVVIFVVVIFSLLLVTPFSRQPGRSFPREFKVVYAGLAVFGIFVIHNNLVDLGVIRGRDVEAIGFLVFVCSLGYLAAFRTYANEQRLLSIQKELEIAQQIQSSILPRESPTMAALDIAARYVPMTAVAGDFYDFIVIDDTRALVFVADVTGHGVPAALIASMLKVALAAQSDHACDPARLLEGVNRSLCGKFEAHFVTAGCLFVDSEKQIVRYAGAGHPPPLFGTANDGRATFRAVEANGLMLGISDKATYPALELPFGPGDRCVLYTDGVVEAKNAAQEEFGVSRLLGFLEANSNLAAGELATAFLTELAHWSGKTQGRAQEDDITLVAVDFKERASP